MTTEKPKREKRPRITKPVYSTDKDIEKPKEKNSNR
jgi:hypothetical protein